MLVDRVRKVVQFIMNKDEVGGYLSPTEYSNIAEQVQLELLMDIKASKEGNAKGSFMFTMQGNDGGLIAMDELGNFRDDLQISQFQGRFSKPGDYIGFNTMTHNFYDDSVRNIELVSDDEWNQSRNSELREPTMKRPICRSVDGKFEVLPAGIPAITLNYYKMPLIPYWNFIIVDGEPVFAETGGSAVNPNPSVANGNSTDFVFSSAMISELVYRICAKMGITLREGEAFQMIKAEEAQ